MVLPKGSNLSLIKLLDLAAILQEMKHKKKDYAISKSQTVLDKNK